MNILSMIGIIMLVGIVVNNAILLLDYYNQLRREGEGVRKALAASCQAKLKPILMSNIAIILGTMPMALGIGASFAEMRKPMGVIIISGIVASTILTLWLIPSLEFLFKGKQK
jgi:HAE1 family hydrophobic/amphiphilic exporter-1